MIDANSTVGEWASVFPGSTRIFESIGIDYCCGGGQSVAAACESAGLEITEVVSSLNEAARAKDGPEGGANWQAAPLTELIDYILTKHHVFTRNELVRLETLIEKVCGVHGSRHPELFQLRTHFTALQQDLLPHMFKEEQMLFPYIIRMEIARVQEQPLPMAMFGTVRNPVMMMIAEHEQAGDLLRAIRTTTVDFTLPPDACISHKTLYQALEGLEADLHAHIHLENNILFPRAVEMERAG
ncbi:MAG: iron-sulfur cluster repair di-iron protein [Acidobacteria bacterium]|nr:iron-sulfur cluster repair di-iron protein [Acidobacteriota bacterium]